MVILCAITYYWIIKTFLKRDQDWLTQIVSISVFIINMQFFQGSSIVAVLPVPEPTRTISQREENYSCIHVVN